MSEVLTESLASWCRARGIGILNIITPGSDYFLVETRVSSDPGDLQVWTKMSEPQARRHLTERGLTDGEADHGIRLCRQWATTTSVAAFASPDAS